MLPESNRDAQLINQIASRIIKAVGAISEPLTLALCPHVHCLSVLYPALTAPAGLLHMTAADTGNFWRVQAGVLSPSAGQAMC